MTRLVCWTLCFLAATASAQAPGVPAADVEQFFVDPSGRGSSLLGVGRTLEPGRFRAGTALSFSHASLRTAPGPGSGVLLRDRLTAQVFGAIGLTKVLEVSVIAPVIAQQVGDARLGLSPSGLATPWVGVTNVLLDETQPLQLTAGLHLGIPLGTAAAQGEGGFAAIPRLTGGVLMDDYTVGFEVSGLFRGVRDFGPTTGSTRAEAGSQVAFSGTVASINTRGPRGEATVRAYVPLSNARPGVEAQVGARWPLGDLEVFGSVGPGFFGEPTTPVVRAFLGVAFSDTPPLQPPCVEGQPYELTRCPHLDKDGDGVPNAADLAPLEPEDKDGFEDEDGRPDEDDDADGVKDVEDLCPRKAGPAANKGCPDTDADGDGVVDRLDGCPKTPEDLDTFEDGDGCPEPDNDLDGVPDVKDACPLQPGIPQEKGCPAKDSDGDTVMDFEDNCPQDVGPKDNQGCPVAQKQLVVITRERLVILDRVFFDTNKASLQKRSHRLLDQVANVMNVHQEIGLVQVEGHTDNVGQAEKNLALSRARADSVVAYLVKKGVPASRLRAAGFGQERPAQPNDTAAGRDFNRRVEFNIVLQD